MPSATAMPRRYPSGLTVEAGHVILTIRDNGIGIRVTETPCPGMGLRSMRYRAGVMNGSIDISPQPGGRHLVSAAALHFASLRNPDSIHAS